MNVLGVIPARYGSTRLPAKPLLKINGRPLLEWVIRGVQNSKTLNDLVVATDHEDILNLAKSLGVRAEMTDPILPSGSDRVWAVAKKEKHDVILNIQGDEPLIEGRWIDALIEGMKNRESIPMGTLAHKLLPDELSSLGAVKLIQNKNHEAIYFSRHPIPYSRESMANWPNLALKHVGLYAYRREFLGEFCAQPPTPLEKSESLEQLRALWMGAKILVIELDCLSVGVDIQEDADRVSEILKARAGG